MGNVSTHLGRKISRPMKNFAVEARAEKVISKDKPVPAPWHPATQEKVNEIISKNPELLKDFDKKDAELEDRLKNVYVTSHDPTLPKRENSSNKPLPLSREVVGAPELGYFEPTKVSKGKLSIRQALAMIGKHNQNPGPHSVMALANEYTVHPQVAGNILKYFQTFELYQPPDSKVKLSVKTYMSLESPESSQTSQLPQLEDGKKSS